MSNLVEIFCDVDVFMPHFTKQCHQTLMSSGEKRRFRASRLSGTKIMALIIAFHQSNYRTFQHFYLDKVCAYGQSYLPTLLSYSQFIRLKQSLLLPLCAYLNHCKGLSTSISFIDSTPLAVGHN